MISIKDDIIDKSTFFIVASLHKICKPSQLHPILKQELYRQKTMINIKGLGSFLISGVWESVKLTDISYAGHDVRFWLKAGALRTPAFPKQKSSKRHQNSQPENFDNC